MPHGILTGSVQKAQPVGILQDMPAPNTQLTCPANQAQVTGGTGRFLSDFKDHLHVLLSVVLPHPVVCVASSSSPSRQKEDIPALESLPILRTHGPYPKFPQKVLLVFFITLLTL